jgi:voltage-gated potassium channel
MSGSAEGLERFEAQTAWPMLVLSLAIIPLLIAPLVADLSQSTESVLFAVDWMIWALFAAEYGVRLYLAPDKRRFVRANVIDLVVVVIPFLRPLRVVRSARMLRLLRAARVGAVLFRAVAALRAVLTRHKLQYTLLVATVVTAIAGLLVAVVERDAPDGNIESIGDGLWWAITTVTTVGYGDRFPTSGIGRGAAVILMLVGVGLFGLLAASLASFLVDRDRGSDQPADPAVREILERLERIERQLEMTSNRASTEGFEATLNVDTEHE